MYEHEEKKLCDIYISDMFKMKYLYGSSFSIIVVIINSLIKKYVRKVVKKIGYHKRSTMHARMMQATYFGTFMNTGVILLIPNANF